jgi:phosphate uptake regulator
VPLIQSQKSFTFLFWLETAKPGLTHNLSERLVKRATLDLELVPSYLDLIFIAHALRRIGDHAANIAEDSFWRDQAIDIRHSHEPKR